MTARAAQGVQDAVINNSGMVQATSVRQENGEIILEADNGTVANSGTLDASGKATGETGGTVKVLGQQVAVADGAKIDVSGDAGGGTALIGGNSRGQGPEINAQNTSVGKATINASAITSGNGGKVVVYSTGNTTVAAAITATGGIKNGITSGKGGLVETSGHVLGIATTATVSTVAPHGTPGDWLLDPDNITIQTGGLGLASGQTFSTSGAVTIDPLTIVTALALGNVTLQANQDITVNTAIEVLLGTNNTLELDAGHSILLNAAINMNVIGTAAAGGNSTLILSANDIRGSGNATTASITLTSGELYASNITLKVAGASTGIGTSLAPVILDYADSGASTLTLTVASANSVFLTSHADNTEISATGATAGNGIFLLDEDVGPILQAPGGSITASTIQLQTSGSTIGAGTPVNVAGPAGAVGLLISTGGANAGLNSTGTVSLSTINTGAGNFSLTSSGDVTQVGGTALTANALNVSTTGGAAIALNNPGNQVTGLVTLSSGNNASLTNTAATSLGASSAGTGTLVVTSGGLLTVLGNLSGNQVGLTATGGSITETTGLITTNSLIANASANVTLTAPNNVSNAILYGGALSVIDFVTTGTLTLGYAGGNPSGVPSPASSVSINASGAVIMSAAGGSEINARNITLTSGGSAGIGGTIQIDDGEAGDNVNLSLATAGNAASFNALGAVTLNSVNLGASGNFTLSAAGLVSQTTAITSADLNVTTTGAGNTISLTNTSNAISGTARFNAAADVTYINGGSVSTSTLGSSSVNGTLSVNIMGPALDLTDTSGQVSATNVLLTAANFIDQAFVGANLPIVATNLNATVTNASTGSLRLLDSGGGLNNAVSGTVLLNAGVNGSVGFSNIETTNLDVTGTVASVEVDAIDPSGMTTPGINLSAPLQATSSVLLNAGGDIQSIGGDGITAPNVSLTSSGGSIGVIGTAIPVTANTVTAATNGQNIVLNLGSFTGEGATVTIGNGTTGINALGTASAPGDVTLVVNHEVSVSQDPNSPIVAHNLAFSSESGGNGVSLTAAGNDVTGTVTLAAPSGDIVFTNGASTTLGSSLAGGALTVTSGGALTVASGNTITVGANGSSTGNISFTAGGTITINSPLNTVDATVNLDTGGTIFLNAPITAAMNGSGPGTIILTANDPMLAGNSDSNGIFNSGTGTLTAATINLQAGGGANGRSGSIGMAASNPLPLSSDTGAVSLAVRSFNGNAYLSSVVPVSIDPGVAANVNGIDTQGNNGLYGEVFLTASGPITQTYGIQSGILTLTATGSSGTITLSDTGVSGDPGNSVFGQVHLYSSGSAVYESGFANTMGANLGASTVGGSLAVVSSNGDLDVEDPSGGAVQVTGTTTLSAGTGNGISISSPVISGSNLSLIADQTISQSSGTGDAHVQTGGVLLAQSTSGSISLTDPGNQVGAIAVFNAAGNVVFQASSSLTLGNVTATGGGIKIESGGNLTIESGSVLTSGLASGYSIQLSAIGNFINDTGPNALSMPSGADFAIFSAAPGGDVFGGLDSGNAAYWGTTYASVAGTNPPNLGDRYVFAFQPTLTVSTGSASKVYGVDDSASLQTGYTVSGLQPGVVGAYLADTVSSVFGTGVQAISLGSAATANVGTYAITLSNNNPASGYIPNDGYAIVAQNSTLTVTPATLFYSAASVSQAYGSANPATFSGTVTGFLNTDTLASATSGTLSFTSAATAASPAGGYAINGSGLSATNYVFTQNTANATALTITPAILTYTADMASRAFGVDNPDFSGTVSGYVNGDTQTSATTGTLVFLSPATSTSLAGSYAIDGSGLNAANYTFLQAPGNATALTISGSANVPPPTILASFTNSIQPPPLISPANTPLGQLDLIALPVVPPPPPPPPPPAPPPVDSPLTDLSDTPNSSDQTTSEVANSLDHASTPPAGARGAIVIPQLLATAPPPPPPPTDISALSSFGNSALWQ
jgi:hypothetical protein